MALKAGERAPDFELSDQHGATVSLAGLLADGPVVLFFYPQAMTAGCTREACHFRDIGAEFEALGAQRIGISADAVTKQAEFDDKHGLGYPLLSDPDRETANAFGVSRRGPLPNKRATFVIGTDQTILEVVTSELNMNVHADKALAALGAAAR
ncbi:MAG: peroxiredoxin [Acidimicrobiales bacterium]|nr:peroxiredoxin [Acidimicrobiales bacterium]MCB1017390.1 peroxiredoxin [Acidimicrobiales bacterium]MCB9372917.1 peroxiredoxin [Microthrixaceae bacterium]